MRAIFLAAPALALASACASAATQPPGAPPSSKSVTLEQPGGDASDPEEAALLRQIKMPFGYGIDKDEQLRVPMPDAKNQKRIRYWAVDHFTAFRYGSDYYVMNIVLVREHDEDEKIDSAECMKRVEKWGHPQMKNFQVKLEPPVTTEIPWRAETVVVRSVEGHVDFGLERRRFSAAYAAYAAYPEACLVFGMAVPWGEHEKLAREVRDRWVHEAVPRLTPLTPRKPTRKED